MDKQFINVPMSGDLHPISTNIKTSSKTSSKTRSQVLTNQAEHQDPNTSSDTSSITSSPQNVPPYITPFTAPFTTPYTTPPYSATISNLLNEKDPIGTTRYAVEEIFLSDEAERDGYKYLFQYPQCWYDTNYNNKSIGLRRIRILKDNLHCMFQLRYSDNGQSANPISFTFITTADWSIERICEELLFMINRHDDIKDKFRLSYDYQNNTVNFVLNTLQLGHSYKLSIEPVIGGASAFHDFKVMFNQTDDYFFTISNGRLTVKNVWDRRHVFIHASFTNYSKHNYLGSSDEFYMNPSKIYEFNNNSPDFYVWLTTNAKTPIIIHELNFILELSLMFNDKNALPMK